MVVCNDVFVVILAENTITVTLSSGCVQGCVYRLGVAEIAVAAAVKRLCWRLCACSKWCLQ